MQMRTDHILIPLIILLLLLLAVILSFSVKTLVSDQGRMPAAEKAHPDAGDIDIVLELAYHNGSGFDSDNNGIANSLSGVIDFNVSSSSVPPDEENLCTLWTVLSRDTGRKTVVCHGAAHCCLLFSLKPALDEWDAVFDLFYGRYGAAEDNTVSSRIIYASEHIDVVGESGIKSLPAYFIRPERYQIFLDRERYNAGDVIELGFNLSNARFVYLDLVRGDERLRLSNQLEDSRKRFKANIPGDYRFVAGIEVNDTLFEIEKGFQIS